MEFLEIGISLEDEVNGNLTDGTTLLQQSGICTTPLEPTEYCTATGPVED